MRVGRGLLAPENLLLAAILSELSAVAGGGVHLSYLSCSLFFGFFLLCPGRLENYARVLGLVTLCTLGGLAVAGELPLSRFAAAAEAAAFYASFLGSLGLMQSLVRRFEILHRVHDILLGGPTAFIYPKYALTSFSIASVLNFSVVNVLCGSLVETLDRRGIVGAERRNWLRSILIVTLRGFALVPMVAPTSVAIAIISREVPALSWGVLVPYTGVAALVFVLIGWVLETGRFRKVSQQRVRLERIPDGTWVLVACVLALLGGIFALVALTHLGVSQAAMIAVPSLTIGYLLIRERKPAELGRELQGNLGGLLNEMFIFGCSAALGTTLAAMVPAGVIDTLTGAGAGQVAFAVGGMILIMAGAAVGIAPLVVLTFLAGLLAQLQASGASPLMGGIALAVGFSMAMMLSPFGPAVMVLARFGRLSRWTVAFGWNLRFTMISLPIMVALLILVSEGLTGLFQG